MHSGHVLLEEPIRMASILEPSKTVSFFFTFMFQINLLVFFFVEADLIRVYLEFFFLFQSFFPAMTKIVGTLGPKSRSVETISGCLKAGMSGTVFCCLALYS